MKTILIVEDNLLNMELLVDLLEDDYGLLKADNAHDGLALAENQNPDLILMDIALPGLDGEEAIKILQSQESTRNIPILVLTAHAMDSDLERVSKLGVVGCFTKPLELVKFSKEVQRILADREDS